MILKMKKLFSKNYWAMKGLALLLLVVIGGSVRGQTFSGTYSFASTTGNVASLTYNGTTISNLTVGALVKTGVTTSSSSGNSRSIGWSTGSTDLGSAGGSVDLGKYYEFTITASAGYTISNPTLTYGVGRSGTGTRRFQWRWDIDSYGSALIVGTANAGVTNTSGVLETPDANSGYTGNVITASTSGQTSITFRFYAYGSESATGTGGLQGDLTFGGTLSSSNPTIIATGTPGTFVSTGVSTPSSEQSFTVSGSNLTNNIVITPPTGYQVSTSTGGSFSPTNPITLTQSSGTVATTTIYARFNPTALTDQVGGNIAITSTGATTQNVAVSGEVTNLSVGAIAFVAFQGATLDYFRIVALQDIPANTRIWFTDKAWDGNGGTLAFTTGEGSTVWTSPNSTTNKGTVIEFAVGAGTVNLGTGAFSSGLGSAGEQLFAYQGTLTSPTFIAGFTSGTIISTGVPTASGTDTWVPAGLTSGTNFVALGGITFGSSYVTAATHNRSLADMRSHIHNTSNLTTTNIITTSQASWPSYTFNIIADEPTTQPSFSSATSVGNNQMNLNFSGGNGTSYMVVLREGSAVSATPTDATNYSTISGSVNYSTATELSAGQKIVYNGPTSTGTVTVTNLSAGTTYHYAIYAYNGTTTTANFYLTSPGTGNQLTTGSANSNVSDIIIHASFTEPNNIAYASTQENSNLTFGNSVEVAKFTLRDGAASTDADANSTTLNSITFTITNNTLLRRLALYNGSTELSEVAVSSGTATFSSLTLAASDNSTQDFSLRASFAGTVTDNLQFSFTVSSVTADIAGSTFAAADAGAATSATNGDRNKIEVTADRLSYVQQPSNVSINTVMSPSVTVSANDVLANRDFDYVTDMTASTTGTFAGVSTNTVTPVSGLATFSNLQFSAGASARTIAVSSGSLTPSGNSNTFNVTASITTGDLAFIKYQSDAPDEFSIITFVDIPASQTFYFTDNQWTTSSGPLATNEQTMTWTTPLTVIPAGTVITFSNSSLSITDVTPAGNGTASLALNGISASGDQIFMYKGTSGSPSQFICGLNFGNSGAWQTVAGLSSNTSFLPADLIDNVNGISFSSDLDNGYYSNTMTGSIATLKSLINNGANWTTNDALQTAPTWAFTVNSTTTTISANTTVQNLSLEASEVLVIGTNTLTINGAISGTGTINGTTSSNLTITGTSGTLNFNQTTSGTTNVLKNLTISGSGTTTLGNTLNITAGAIAGTVIVGTGATLATGGNLILKSDANGTASIGNSAGTITGNITVERYITANRKYRFLAAPVVGATAANWRNNGTNTAGIGTHITGGSVGNNFDQSTLNAPSAFWYNEVNAGNLTDVGSGATSDPGWTAFADGNTEALTNGKGFRIFVRGDRTISLTGSIPTANNTTLSVTGSYPGASVSIATTKTNSNTNSGFNLVGNPYPATIDWNAVTKGANISATYSTFNPTSNSYVMWNGLTGDATRYIASGQAFFVQQTGLTGGITIAEANKVSNAAGNFFRNKLTDHLKVSMKYDSANYDAAFIHFREDALNEFDNYDGLKFQNAGVNIASVGENGKRYNINSLASLTETTEIPLSVLGSALTNFELKFDDVESFKNHELYLIDHYLNKMLLLSNGFTYPISLSSDSASVKDGRFKIVFVQKATGINSNEKNAHAFILYPNPAANTIHLLLDAKNTNNENVSFEIFNQLGARLQQGNLDFTTAKDQTIAIDQLAQGSYFIKLQGQQHNQTIKFIK